MTSTPSEGRANAEKSVMEDELRTVLDSIAHKMGCPTRDEIKKSLVLFGTTNSSSGFQNIENTDST